MSRYSFLFFVFIFLTVFSSIVIEEEVFRGAIYEISYNFPKIASIMWRFRNDSYWERGVLFHVVAPKGDDYEITVRFELYDTNNNLIHSETATITESLSANTETLLYVVFTKEIPVRPIDFLEGKYYAIVKIDISTANNEKVLGSITSWVPKPRVFQEALVLPSTYVFRISYKDESAISDFQCTSITYGLVFESKDYKKIDYVYATAEATSSNGVNLQGYFLVNGDKVPMSSWDGSEVYFYPNNLNFSSNMAVELSIILYDS